MRNVIAIVIVAVLGGALGFYSYTNQQEELHQETAQEVKMKLWSYQSKPNVESLSHLADQLDAYGTKWYARDREDVKRLSQVIRSSLDTYCISIECKAFEGMYIQRREQESKLASLKSEYGDVVRKSLMCHRVFDRDGSDVLMECTDIHAVKKAVLIVSEDIAKRLRPFDYHVADVQDLGIKEVTLNSGFKEFVPYYREVKRDYAGMEKAQAALKAIDTYEATNRASHEVELQRDMDRVAKSVDDSLKKIAALFGVEYSPYSPSQLEAESPVVGMENDLTMRSLSDHTVANVLFHIDSYSPGDPVGPWVSKIQVEGKDIVVTEDIISFEEAVDANNGGLFVYSESGGGKSCDAFPYKAVLVSNGEIARTTPVLGYCDTTFKVNGDEILSESKEAGIHCRIDIKRKDVDCQTKSS